MRCDSRLERQLALRPGKARNVCPVPGHGRQTMRGMSSPLETPCTRLAAGTMLLRIGMRVGASRCYVQLTLKLSMGRDVSSTIPAVAGMEEATQPLLVSHAWCVFRREHCSVCCHKSLHPELLSWCQRVGCVMLGREGKKKREERETQGRWKGEKAARSRECQGRD